MTSNTTERNTAANTGLAKVAEVNKILVLLIRQLTDGENRHLRVAAKRQRSLYMTCYEHLIDRK
jgi:hypothetical protein